MRVSRRVLQPPVTPSSAPQGPFCKYCLRNLATLSIFVRCAHHHCNNLPLCVECFSVGADDRAPHRATHPFRLISKHSLSHSIYHPEWTLHHEFRLLHAMCEYGFGHWKQIADYVGKGMQKCQNHYLSVYLQSKTLLPTPLLPSPPRASNNTPSRVVAPESQPSAPPPRLTQLPLRADFEFEWDDPAEDVIAHLDTPTKPSQQQLDTVLQRLYAFDARLHRRAIVKQYILESPVLHISDDDPDCLRNEHLLSDRICVLAWLLTDNVFHSFYDSVMLEFRKARSVYKAVRRRTAQLHASRSDLNPNPSISKSNVSSKRRRSGKARSTPFSKRKRSSARQERPQSPLGDITMPNTPDSQPISPNDALSPSSSPALEPWVQPSPAILQKAKRLRLIATSPNPPLEPKQVDDMEDASKLTSAERSLCAVLHIAPRDFLEMKSVMLSTVALQMRRRNAKQSAGADKISVDNPPRRLAKLSCEKKQSSSPTHTDNANSSLIPPSLTLPDVTDQFVPNSADLIQRPRAQSPIQLEPSIRLDAMLIGLFRSVPKDVPAHSVASTRDHTEEMKTLGRITCKSRPLPPPSDTKPKPSTSNAICDEDPTSSQGITALAISNGDGEQSNCEQPVSHVSNTAIVKAGRGSFRETSKVFLTLRLRQPRSSGTGPARRKSNVKRVAGKRNGGLPTRAARLDASNELAVIKTNLESQDVAVVGRNQVDSVALEEQSTSQRRALGVKHEKDSAGAAYKGPAAATRIDEGFTASGVEACNNFVNEKFGQSFSGQVSGFVTTVTGTDNNASNRRTIGSYTNHRGRPSRETLVSTPIPVAMVAHSRSHQAETEHVPIEGTTENQALTDRTHPKEVTSPEVSKLSGGIDSIEGGALPRNRVHRGTSRGTDMVSGNADEHLPKSTSIATCNRKYATRLPSLSFCPPPQENITLRALQMKFASSSFPRTGLLFDDQQTTHPPDIPSTNRWPVGPSRVNEKPGNDCSDINGNIYLGDAANDRRAVTYLDPVHTLSEPDEDIAHCVGFGEREVIKEFVLDWGKPDYREPSKIGTSRATKNSARNWGNSKPDSRDVEDDAEVRQTGQNLVSGRPTRGSVRRTSASEKRYRESSETSYCPDSDSEYPLSILEERSGQDSEEPEYRDSSKRTLRPRKATKQSSTLVPTRRSTRIQKRSRRLLDYSPEPPSRAPKRQRVESRGSGKGKSYPSKEVLLKDDDETDEYVPKASGAVRKRANKNGKGKTTKRTTPSAKRSSGKRASKTTKGTAGIEIITPQDVRPRSCTLSSDSNSSGPGTAGICSNTGPDIARNRYALRRKSAARATHKNVNY